MSYPGIFLTICQANLKSSRVCGLAASYFFICLRPCGLMFICVSYQDWRLKIGSLLTHAPRRTSSWLFLFEPAWPTSAKQIGIGLMLTLTCPCLAARYFFLPFIFLLTQLVIVSSSDPTGMPRKNPAIMSHNISR